MKISPQSVIICLLLMLDHFMLSLIIAVFSMDAEQFPDYYFLKVHVCIK